MELAKLCRYLDSVRGTDKTLMLVQYASKIIIWFVSKRDVNSLLAKRISNLVGPVADFRMLLRYYGLIPLVKWIIDSEKNPDPNPRIAFLVRLQNMCNLLYYPLEHAYWLAIHHVIPMSGSSRDKIGMWSCRFWAAYVCLYFAQLWEEKKMLDFKQTALAKKDDQVALNKLNQEKRAWQMATIINASYFPLTVHWSLEKSSFPDVGVGIFGTIAALAQINLAWKAA